MCSPGALLSASWTGDIIDDFYAPFVRTLGSLVIAFALAETELLDLVMEKVAKHSQALRPGRARLTTKPVVNASQATHNDRNGGRSVLGGHDRFVADRHDDILFRIDEFAGEA
jgi:hypothetical protein